MEIQLYPNVTNRLSALSPSLAVERDRKVELADFQATVQSHKRGKAHKKKIRLYRSIEKQELDAQVIDEISQQQLRNYQELHDRVDPNKRMPGKVRHVQALGEMCPSCKFHSLKIQIPPNQANLEFKQKVVKA